MRLYIVDGISRPSFPRASRAALFFPSVARRNATKITRPTAPTVHGPRDVTKLYGRTRKKGQSRRPCVTWLITASRPRECGRAGASLSPTTVRNYVPFVRTPSTRRSLITNILSDAFLRSTIEHTPYADSYKSSTPPAPPKRYFSSFPSSSHFSPILRNPHGIWGIWGGDNILVRKFFPIFSKNLLRRVFPLSAPSIINTRSSSFTMANRTPHSRRDNEYNTHDGGQYPRWPRFSATRVVYDPTIDAYRKGRPQRRPFTLFGRRVKNRIKKNVRLKSNGIRS